MRTLIILTAISLLTGCAVTGFPKFPPLSKHYMVEVRDEEITPEVMEMVLNPDAIPELKEVARCLEFDIVTTRPYVIRFNREAPMDDCHLIGGYKPKEVKSIINFVDDVYIWAEDRKHCFKSTKKKN